MARRHRSNPHQPKEHGMPEERTHILLKQLEAGVVAIQGSDEFKRVLRTVAKFHGYSFNNILLIMMQCPEATRVAGYKTWQSLGRQVKRGERGISILAPRPYRVMEAGTGTNSESIAREGVAFRTIAVFDIGQTEGAELPTWDVDPLTGSDGAALYTRLVSFCEAEGLAVTNRDLRTAGDDRHSSYNGYYRRSDRLIFVKHAAPTQMAKTLLHELAHHLDEELLTSPQNQRETVAESTAYVVAAHFSLDTTAYSFPYLASWAGRADGSALIKTTMTRVQHIAHTILDGLAANEPDPASGHEHAPAIPPKLAA